MYLIMSNRDGLVAQIPPGGTWAEIGVYRGDFSQKILDICRPSELWLVDNWKFEIVEHNELGDAGENFAAFSGKIHWQHFGDDPNATQEQNFQYVKSRFAQLANVKIIRDESARAIHGFPDRHFDVMYIDANHQYEYVLRDLMAARSKVKRGGIILMNDFYEGPGGAEQNLGVLGAVNTFVKRHDYHYVAMSHGPYADVALTDDPGSPCVRQFLTNLNNSDLVFVGIADAHVANLRYRLYRKENGDTRYVAML